MFAVGTDRTGLTVILDVESLATSLATMAGESIDHVKEIELIILPMKPENVSNKQTHSVKLVGIKSDTYET